MKVALDIVISNIISKGLINGFNFVALCNKINQVWLDYH